MIKQASYLGVVVQDVTTATAFYRDTLGIPVDEGESNPGHFTQFKLAGGAVLALQASANSPENLTFVPGFIVDDVDSTYASWQAKGVQMLDEPNDRPFWAHFPFSHARGTCVSGVPACAKVKSRPSCMRNG